MSSGQCPRCGVMPTPEPVRRIKDGLQPRTLPGNDDALSEGSKLSTYLYGTIYDTEFDEWQCMECGCVFNDGLTRNMAEEWGFGNEGWSNGGWRISAAKGAQ